MIRPIVPILLLLLASPMLAGPVTADHGPNPFDPRITDCIPAGDPGTPVGLLKTAMHTVCMIILLNGYDTVERAHDMRETLCAKTGVC